MPTPASDSVAAIRAMLDKTGARALLLVQSSNAPAGTFVQLPSVIVLEGATDWDRDSVRNSLAAAAGKLWTTSQLGAGWTAGTSGRHAIERLNGLGTLIFTTQGRLLFLSDDAQLLATVLDRVGTTRTAGALTYAAGFRNSKERSNYERIMASLDFSSAYGFTGLRLPSRSENAPAFFTGNLASLGRVLSNIAEIRVTEEDRGTSTVQTIVYQEQQ